MQLEAKRAQVAAFFLMKRGGTLTVMELVKFLYLADREALELYGFPITWDQPVAMKHGPLTTETYNCIKGERGMRGKEWPRWISERTGVKGCDLNLIRKVDSEDLDELSEAEIEILESIWKRFGHMDAVQLSAWTHKNCTEWKNPGKTSSIIPYEEIFKALGKADGERSVLAQHIREQMVIGHYLHRS